MKKRLKVVLTVVIIVIILTICAFFLVKYLKEVKAYNNKVEALAVSNIDISSVVDGVYIGECDVDFIYAKVKVEVKDGKIISIELLEHQNDRGSSAEQIVDVIIKEQIIDVDAVSGATNSSKTIQKAIENALTNDSV